MNRIREYLEPCDMDDDGGEWEPVRLGWREVVRIFGAVVVALAMIAAVAWAVRIGWGN